MASSPFLYQPQGRVRAMPLPSGGGRGFGAETAGAVAGLGAAGAEAAQRYQAVQEREAESEARIAELEDNRRLARASSEAAVRYAEMQARIGAKDAELRAAMPAGGEGYEQALFEFHEQEQGGFVETLADQRLQERFLPLLADARANLTVRARVAALGASADKAKLDAETMADLFANTLRTNPDPAQATNFLSAVDAFVDTQALPDTAKAAVRQALRQKVVLGQWHGINDADPQRALDMLAAGALDEEMTPEQIQAMRGLAESAVNRLRVEAERQAAIAERAAKEEEETALGEASRGVQVDPARMEEMAKRAEARGDTSKAAELRAASASAAVTNAYQDALPVQITAEMAKIEADKDWREKPELVYRHNALAELRERRRKDEANIAPPDWTDAGSVADYEQAVRVDAAARGIPARYLPSDMIARLQDEMKSGTAGQGRVLGLIATLSPHAGLAAARQIAPDDRVFQWAATLDDPRARNLAIAGRDASAANDKLAPKKRMDALFRDVETALSGFGADDVKAAKEAAASIAAEMLRQQGKTEWDEEVAADALHLALGGRGSGTGRVGGVGRWKDAPVLLPDDMGQAEFDRRLSVLGGNANAYVGGRQITHEALRRFRPVAVGDGLYHFHDAYGRPVIARDGTPTLLDIRRVRVPEPQRPAASQRAPYRPGSGEMRSAYEGLPRPVSDGRASPNYRIGQ